jgi:hypothetical protein
MSCLYAWDKDRSTLLQTKLQRVVRLRRLQQADLRQVVVRLYTSFGVDASPATPHRRPRRIVFANIARGHHRRQPSTSTNSITSPSSPTEVNVNANKTFYFSY